RIVVNGSKGNIQEQERHSNQEGVPYTTQSTAADQRPFLNFYSHNVRHYDTPRQGRPAHYLTVTFARSCLYSCSRSRTTRSAFFDIVLASATSCSIAADASMPRAWNAHIAAPRNDASPCFSGSRTSASTTAASVSAASGLRKPLPERISCAACCPDAR